MLSGRDELHRLARDKQSARRWRESVTRNARRTAYKQIAERARCLEEPAHAEEARKTNRDERRTHNDTSVASERERDPPVERAVSLLPSLRKRSESAYGTAGNSSNSNRRTASFSNLSTKSPRRRRKVDGKMDERRAERERKLTTRPCGESNSYTGRLFKLKTEPSERGNAGRPSSLL